jgi:5-methylcytosine-specific restriction endonuclease McrA
MNYKGRKDKIFICKNCNSEFGFKGYSFDHVFCNVKCVKEFQSKQRLNKKDKRRQAWLNGDNIDIKKSRRLIKEFVIERDGYKCSICGISDWNGKKITLWCDHIDGNAANNHPTNFRLLCPNCDSQNETFGAKNIGRGRKSRGLPQYD